MQHSARESAKRHRFTSKVTTASISIFVVLGLSACFNSTSGGPTENQQAGSLADQPSQKPKKNSLGQWYVTCGLPDADQGPDSEQKPIETFNNERLGHREGILFSKLRPQNDDVVFAFQDQWVKSDGIGWWKLFWSRLEMDPNQPLNEWPRSFDSPFLNRTKIVKGFHNDWGVAEAAYLIKRAMPPADELVCDDRDVES